MEKNLAGSKQDAQVLCYAARCVLCVERRKAANTRVQGTNLVVEGTISNETGDTIAGVKKRRNTSPPTAVSPTSGNSDWDVRRMFQQMACDESAQKDGRKVVVVFKRTTEHMHE